MSVSRALNRPRPVRVRADEAGVPLAVDGRAIEAVRESWLVEDRWWTPQPLRRRYWEVLSVHGGNTVVFHELSSGGWFTQMG
jgi:CO dehydrogenase/acetyl-CoA synthase delta subunit